MPLVQVEAGIESERKKQLADFFDRNAIQLNEEGLVVKDLSGPYLASFFRLRVIGKVFVWLVGSLVHWLTVD